LKLLKELIWGRKFTFESELSSTEFIEKLKSKTTASSIFYPDRPNKIFVGKIRGNSIWLRRHIPIRKAFTPLLRASVKDFEEKSAIIGYIRLNLFIQLFLCFFLCLMTFLSFVLIYNSNMDDLADWIVAIPLIFLFLFFVLILLMARMEIDSLDESLPALLEK
jgi:hypothetical protein